MKDILGLQDGTGLRWWFLSKPCSNSEKPRLYHKKPGTKIQLRIDQRKHWEKNWMHKFCLGIYHLFCPDSYLQREQKVSCHKLTFFVKTVQLRFFISEPCIFSYWFKSLRGFSKTSVKRVNFGIFQIFQTRSFTKQKADRGGYSLSF